MFELSVSEERYQIDSTLFWTVHDGALGASNSILVVDDPLPTPKKYMFVSTSMGMRRFEVF